MSESVAVRHARPYCRSRVYTDEAAETIARTVRLFEARVEHCGRDHAVEEFLLSEEAALASAPDYPAHLDRLRIYDEAWRTAIVLH